MIKRAVIACAWVGSTAWAAVGVDALWTVNDPAASEARCRQALDTEARAAQVRQK